MQLLKKILILVLIITITTYTSAIGICTSVTNTTSPVRASVFLYKFDTLYLSLVQKALENIQAQNPTKIKFTFYDGEGNQAVQNESISTALKNDSTDILLVNLVNKDSTVVTNIVNEARQYDIPIILFNIIEPNEISIIKAYPKALGITVNLKQAAHIQAQLVIDEWNSNKDNIDKNRNNILEYAILTGSNKSEFELLRQKIIIQDINDAGIKIKELASLNAYFNKDLAKDAVNSLFLRYGNTIEAIIADNDSMAIGAIEALQNYGYNIGDKAKTILITGFDAIPEARELIDKGFMAGSVAQPPEQLAEALYKVGMNLVSNKNPLEDTNYKFNDTGVVIEIPFFEIYKKIS